MEHVLEGKQVALHRDAQVTNASQNLQSPRVLGAVLETLPVNLMAVEC